MRVHRGRVGLHAVSCFVAVIAFSLGLTRTARALACAGDCNVDGRVTISELILGVNIALGLSPVADCMGLDANGNQSISISELVSAVNSALNGCEAIVVPSFQGLGELPGGSESIAHAVSDDGSTVVGEVTDSTNRTTAFRWHRDTGLVSLGTLPRQSASFGWAVDAHGTTIGGYGFDVNSQVTRAFRWTTATGMVALALLPGSHGCAAVYGLSSDGSVAAGYSADSAGHYLIVTWDQTGTPHSFGDDTGVAFAITPDGHVVAGVQSMGTSHTQPFRWEQSTGLVSLGDIPGGSGLSGASAISADGRVISGEADLDNQSVAYRWTQDTGMVVLADLPGGHEDSDNGMGLSQDGSIVVGSEGLEEADANVRVAVIWDANGVHSIAERLQALGVDLDGWQLEYASDVTPDGQTIVGGGVSPEGKHSAWIAVLPIPPALTH